MCSWSCSVSVASCGVAASCRVSGRHVMRRVVRSRAACVAEPRPLIVNEMSRERAIESKWPPDTRAKPCRCRSSAVCRLCCPTMPDDWPADLTPANTRKVAPSDQYTSHLHATLRKPATGRTLPARAVPHGIASLVLTSPTAAVGSPAHWSCTASGGTARHCAARTGDVT